MSEISIYIENLYQDFQNHLNTNKRVLFSGAYGTGKTYFLREYFKAKESEYNIFHLLPVNYQVSQNEDIFELVKYDILYHILGKGWEFKKEEQEKISKTLALQTYAMNKASSAFKAVTQILTLGKSKSVVEGADELEKIITGFTKYYKELNTEQDSLDKIREFAQVFENKKGSIYECDNITQLIYELLEEHSAVESEENTKKQNVLVIDDLDRIDPEHIFRILNVFSAHFDLQDEDSNKFGFDKVVFVCDIENIRNIFSAKYGVNTDFNGYMNKFFSSHIYHFDNKEEIKKVVKSYVERKLSNNEIHKRFTQINDDIIGVLSMMINSKSINIRQLKNLESFDFKVSFFDKYRDENITMFLYWHLINLLLKIFNNDFQKLRSACSSLELTKEELWGFDRKIDKYLKCLIFLVDIERVNKYFHEEPHDFIYRNRELDINVKYSLINTGNYYWSEIEDVTTYDSFDFKKQDGYGVNNYSRKLSLNDIKGLFSVAINELERNGLLIRS